MPSSELENKVFVRYSCPDNLKLHDDLVLTTAFFRIEKYKTKLNKESYFMMMVNEVSTFIRYQRVIGEKKLLEQINAIVSHEMRNPLNSILAMVSKIIYLKDLMLA